ncbi:hypothetical protein Desor_5582 [Desulfosporosinus orientis DSM 765]|uniref:Uncharacterized protein n=1 Tax=Desulfosporosinus orientis (strain ATCC 19365 / DSM 765 / NCIMB 8382 / VKM B-1628 / Singapore I) TaxID=768706 RepID=G7WI32_DESOD|nr:hypothetical protein Desor_5582 [Desulfosporosinus orientis DSM 765]
MSLEFKGVPKLAFTMVLEVIIYLNHQTESIMILQPIQI